MDIYDRFDLLPHECSTVKKGDVLGKLTILGIGKKPFTYRYYAICKCQCGSPIKIIRLDGMVSGVVLSCGCYHKNKATKHGNWNHRLYPIWHHMMNRCYNTKNNKYYCYGARGITVCEEWHNINNFIKDMYPSFREGLWLDRADNDKGYSPDNCRWITPFRQASNKSNNKNITYNNQTHCLAEWSRITNISYGTLFERIHVLKWSIKRALTTPPISAKERCRKASVTRWSKTSQNQ